MISIKKLVPVISVMFGCGAGGGAGTDDKGMKRNHPIDNEVISF